jgi:hypothetical protein
MNYKTEYYEDLDIEFKQKFEKFICINLNEKQQIERYALDIAFWKNEMITITPDSDNKTVAQSFMATQAHTDIIKNITTKFNKTIQQKIMKLADQLLANHMYEQERRIIIDACMDLTRTDVDEWRCGRCWLACEGSCSQADKFIRANIPSLCANTTI